MSITKKMFCMSVALTILLMSCQSLNADDESSMPQQNGFPDKPALPNDSGIEGVQTFPDKSDYHNHVPEVQAPDGNIPPPFGEHLNAWQNCGVYDQPIELGNALHSLEHGAVWLTYAPNLDNSQVAELQNMVRGHDFVLMSPYPSQTVPVVLTAWGVQLVIDSLPDDRIEKFIDYYELGPQNPEPGAPCSGAVGNPIN
ncbi:MAG TPA: DUF3105 domain-containing protein [Anaerolineales bacterium]|nr:DUF3105 domain-containing protein [Anaerolineales bacterium]